MTETLRAFIAVSVDAELKSEIARLEAKLRISCGNEAVRWVKAEQLHLTLKFFGNVRSDQISELSDALRRACHGIAPFWLSLGGLGCFPTFQRPTVIWLGVGGDVGVLEMMQQRIEQATNGCGSHSENRGFRPHLTIGRVKAGGRRAGLAVQNTPVGELGRWSVKQVELIQSTLSPQGSTYRRLACVPLGVAQ